LTLEKNTTTFILGAGMTGLAAGFASGLAGFEAADAPGGICSSYYIRPGEKERLHKPPGDGEAYRFDVCGGHWIFGGEPPVHRFISSLVSLKRYVRKSSVYFQDRDLYVPYPLQNHLRFLDKDTIVKALAEMAEQQGSFTNMKEWMAKNFGPTLCDLFFYPFHELYTAGIYDRIAPQDAYKSPVDLKLAIRGALDESPAVGYNATFVYPAEDLNTLARRMASHCKMNYGKKVERIDVREQEAMFSDGTTVPYSQLISTLPLNKMMELTGLEVDQKTDPCTSVLVLNIGAVREARCPDDHWLYNTNTNAGFHRVGFYSNVDPAFLPKSAQINGGRVSIYVERAYADGERPTENEIRRYGNMVVKELQEWGYIGDAEVVDPTWIEVAYTWNWPNSAWKNLAFEKLEKHGIYQVGRYARWSFQGIADSIRDGFHAGASFRTL